MRLLEYESKEIFSKFDIPLANYIVVKDSDEIEEKVKFFSFPAIVKSQIAIGSREKAGLIKIAQTQDEAVSLCRKFFSRKVGRFEVEAIIIEELAKIDHEYYCSIALDASGRQFSFIASKKGGVNIEEVSKKQPEAIIRLNFSYTNGLTEEVAKEAAIQLGFSNKLLNASIEIFLTLWEITKTLEAQLVDKSFSIDTPWFNCCGW
jgi:succinyl-CoA synthetase beta subunit